MVSHEGTSCNERLPVKDLENMKLLFGGLFILAIEGVIGCSAPKDNYHYVQTKVFIEDAQFERDEALRLEDEIRRNNESLREISTALKSNVSHDNLTKKN